MRYTLSWTAFLEQIGHSAINRHTREESTYPGGTASILISFTHRSLALLAFWYQEPRLTRKPFARPFARESWYPFALGLVSTPPLELFLRKVIDPSFILLCMRAARSNSWGNVRKSPSTIASLMGPCRLSIIICTAFSSFMFNFVCFSC